MRIKFIEAEDFINYKKPSMFIGTSFCTFKCEKECPECHCQNSELALAQYTDVSNDYIVNKYLSNDITKAVVFGGLEPLDQFTELEELIKLFREQTEDEIIVYTGYYEDEVKDKIKSLKKYKNIIMKFGRFVPNKQSHIDDILGVELKSDNQYAKVIS